MRKTAKKLRIHEIIGGSSLTNAVQLRTSHRRCRSLGMWRIVLRSGARELMFAMPSACLLQGALLSELPRAMIFQLRQYGKRWL